MRKRYVKSVLNIDKKDEYLHCNKRPSKPRLNHLVCEAKCKKHKNCHEYSEWYFQYYGEEIEVPKKKTRKRRRNIK